MEEKAGTQVPMVLTKFRILDSFLLEPLFIIGVLVLTVVIVIIISHYMNRNEANDEEANKTVAFSDTNLQTVTHLLDNIGDSIELPTIGDGTSEVPAILVSDEEGVVSDKIMTIMPQKDFRDFPRTEEEQMKMRREIMLQMLALPPLA